MTKIPVNWLATVSTPASRRRTRTSIAGVRIEYRDGMLELHSPYDDTLVAMLKSAIPYTMRAWSKTRKSWQVDPTYADQLRDIVYQALGVDVQIPPSTIGKTISVETRLLDVRYLGRVKAREDGSENAFGWCNGQWSVIIDGMILRSWFGQDTTRPQESNTLYAVLGIARTDDAKMIKDAYRRMARQWHPDVCGEPDAHAQFIMIQRAYDILSDPTKRTRYNAGLALETSLDHKDRGSNHHEYQPPLRCGLILANGVERLGRFIVQDILSWLDIENDKGEVLVTSWELGADAYTERWIIP